MTALAAAARSLLSARAVRDRAHAMLRLCERDELNHWRLERQQLPALVDFVIEVARQNYPQHDIPFHARWRHFAAGGDDRFAALVRRAKWPDRAALARAAFDLVIVSVLLDAGAGPAWHYRDARGNIFNRSEGLAVASLEMFAAGGFSNSARDPLRVDAARLQNLTAADLADCFQVISSNPLIGLDGRVALLASLGRTVAANATVFALTDQPRPGGLFDYLVGRTSAGKLAAEEILVALLMNLGSVWPSRLSIGGVALGDCWRHSAMVCADATTGLVPFHKLSQWLAYSLIEPLQWAGVTVTDIDGLTGLPEYRNGGLFMDAGVIALKHPQEANHVHAPGCELVIEWRALTVALLDEVASLMRAKLGLDSQSLPLAKVLEGGTWAAGRRIAAQKRLGGTPPLTIDSDGTVF
jgi:hypothetical protein